MNRNIWCLTSTSPVIRSLESENITFHKNFLFEVTGCVFFFCSSVLIWPHHFSCRLLIRRCTGPSSSWMFKLLTLYRGMTHFIYPTLLIWDSCWEYVLFFKRDFRRRNLHKTTSMKSISRPVELIEQLQESYKREAWGQFAYIVCIYVHSISYQFSQG